MQKKSERGVTVVEVVIASLIAAVVMLGLITAMIEAMRLDQVTRENIVAMNAARAKVEEIRNTADFTTIFSNYGPASANKDFTVDGLDPVSGDSFEGKIEFPCGTGATANELHEDSADSGLARDLDGDGAIESTDMAATYAILPIRITIEWRGVRADYNKFEVYTLVSPR